MLIRTATLACAFAVTLVTAQAASAQTFPASTAFASQAPAPQPSPSYPVPAYTDSVQPVAEGASMEGGCDSCSTNTFGSTVQSDWDAFKQRFKLDTDRNEAWPHPFLAADRQAYRDMFRPCYDRGWEIQHTLSDACFDADTGALNPLGANKIAELVYAAPSNRKTLFVHQSGSQQKAQERMELVRAFIKDEYGRSAGVNVAATLNFPTTASGTYSETITRQWHSSLPRPVLQAQSVSNAVNGGN